MPKEFGPFEVIVENDENTSAVMVAGPSYIDNPTCYETLDCVEIYDFYPLDETWKEAIERAHLFAAAPELLAAAKSAEWLLNHLDTEGLIQHKGTSKEVIASALEQIQIAIKKTEGDRSVSSISYCREDFEGGEDMPGWLALQMAKFAEEKGLGKHDNYYDVTEKFFDQMERCE